MNWRWWVAEVVSWHEVSGDTLSALSFVFPSYWLYSSELTLYLPKTSLRPLTFPTCPSTFLTTSLCGCLGFLTEWCLTFMDEHPEREGELRLSLKSHHRVTPTIVSYLLDWVGETYSPYFNRGVSESFVRRVCEVNMWLCYRVSYVSSGWLKLRI